MLTKFHLVISQERLNITQEMFVPSCDLVKSPIYILMEKQILKIWGKKIISSFSSPGQYFFPRPVFSLKKKTKKQNWGEARMSYVGITSEDQTQNDQECLVCCPWMGLQRMGEAGLTNR